MRSLQQEARAVTIKYQILLLEFKQESVVRADPSISLSAAPFINAHHGLVSLALHHFIILFNLQCHFITLD